MAAGFLLGFVLWTLAVRFIDVQAIGPKNSSVGFATVNSVVHKFTGVNMTLYTITDWLGLVPVGVGFGFAMLGLFQWIKRRGLKYVDYDIFVLGGFYIVTIATYLLFETVVVNYRPVLINGYLEASFPSSTTILVLCVMTTAILQFNSRIRNQMLKKCIGLCICLFMAYMVIGRFVSGVHWMSDIVGGILVSAGLVLLYNAVFHIKK